MGASATHPSVVESVDPATGEAVARFACTPTEHLPAMVERGRRAQEAWAAVSVEARGALLGRFGEKFYARREEIAEMVRRETGKPQAEALFGDVLIALEAAKYYSRNAGKLLRERRVSHQNLAVKAKSGRLRYEPFGLIGILSPWNYPVAIPAGQIASALMAGNAVVFKPSELTPGSGDLIARCFLEAGLPEDVLQVAQGGGEVGAALIEAQPEKVVFTGSVKTGRRIAETCGRRLIPSVLELGGKDAMIVLAGADLETASSAAVWGGFTNCGQACLSVERIYVEQAIAEEFSEKCAAKMRLLKVGPSSDPDTEVGPMIRAEAADRIEAQVREAVLEGARVLAGGRRRADLGPCFFEPTVLAGVNHSMGIMRDETFGPILAIQTVQDAEEAVALANDSVFGLAASVWTGDARRGRRLAERLKAGAVMVNDVGSYFGMAEAPHGGRGQSGWGRTHGGVGLREMVQVKYVDVDWLPRWPKAWWFGYNNEVNQMAERFIEFAHAPSRRKRLSQAKAMVQALWRGHRI